MTSLNITPLHITRFPPEPNGFLHLGHCKSIFINWSEQNSCHLRLDDTNPDKENHEFVENIIDDIKWLGFDPGHITYTSDYFDQLYEYAILLIKNAFAYVDFTQMEQMRDERHRGIENAYRSKSVEWNLEEFEKMRKGQYTKSNCVLRLKIDMQNLNHVLRDPIAYRISFEPHHRTGTKWCIYPSYDYSHGIIDALEGITHSYCTDEFYIRRDLYYWSPNKLIELGINLKPAEEIEYGKLSVENNILSKRNINKLITDGHLSDYTDPRLLTVKGLRRRGFVPSLIKQIVECSGFGKTETVVSSKFLDNLLRTYYDPIAIRAFAIINPLKVVINDSNCENTNKLVELIHHNHPSNKELGSHNIFLTNELYIEQEDVLHAYNKDFYRFMPNNKVRLRYDNSGNFYEYDTFNAEANFLTIKKADITGLNPKKIKGCIHWISDIDAVLCKFITYTDLASNGIFDPNSKKESIGYVQNFCMEQIKLNQNTCFQFERIGFFKFDGYTELTNIKQLPVFIQIVGLFDNKKI